MKPQGYIPDSASPSAHEGADLDIPLVARFAVALAVLLVTVVIVMLFIFHHFDRVYAGRTSEAAPLVTTAELPPLPRLQTTPRLDLAAVHTQEDLHLNHYAWVDGGQDLAQIPIDRAMALWVQNYRAGASSPAPTSTNAATAMLPPAGMTELQMRQQKAKGDDRVP